MENRQSYRCRVPDGCEQALVRTAHGEVRLALAEESAGGFTLESKEPPPFDANTLAELTIHSGEFEVRIVHVDEVDGHYRVGVQRLRAISKSAADPKSMNRGWSFVQQTLLFAGCVGMGALVWYGVVEPWKNSGKGSGVSVAAVPVPPPTVQVFEGVGMLTAEDAARELDLTDTQKQSIAGTFDQTSRRLAEAFHEKGNDPVEWRKESKRLVDEAFQRVLCSMTDEQVLSWRRLLVARQRQAAATTASVIGGGA